MTDEIVTQCPDLSVSSAFDPEHFNNWWRPRGINRIAAALRKYRADEAGKIFSESVEEAETNFRRWREEETSTARTKHSTKFSADTQRIHSALISRVYGKHAETPARLLVAGSVQSGKTGSYTELISALLDSRGVEGAPEQYIIVVLAGVHNKLRRQTQERLEAALVDYPLASAPLTWLTSKDKDISRRAARTIHENYSASYIAVVKKVRAPLETATRVLNEVPSGNKFGVIVIDDECDQITPDEETKKKVNSSRVAKLLWGDFEDGQWSMPSRYPAGIVYIGYSATPYGNVLLGYDRERSMYPETYMHVLTEGEGYMGYDYYWPAEGDPQDVWMVPGHEIEIRRAGKKRFDVVQSALEDAVLWFFVAASLKRGRLESGALAAKDRHSTMLVNSHTRVADHEEMKRSLVAYVNNLREEWRHNPDAVVERLLRVCTSCTKPTSKVTEIVNEARQALHSHLATVFANVTVVCDNSRSKERLEYPDPRDAGLKDKIVEVIAVGGYTLSRGITLQGLVSSYLSRVTQVFYDSYLQLSRWFGYRRGYKDLTRLWLSAEASNTYAQIAVADRKFKKSVGEAGRDPEGPYGHARIYISCIAGIAPSRVMDSYMRSTAFKQGVPHGPNLFGETPGWDDVCVREFTTAAAHGHDVARFLEKYSGPDAAFVKELANFITEHEELRDAKWDIRIKSPQKDESERFLRNSSRHPDTLDVWYVKTTTDPKWRKATRPTLVVAPATIQPPAESVDNARKDWIVAAIFDKAYGHGAVYQNESAQKLWVEQAADEIDETDADVS